MCGCRRCGRTLAFINTRVSSVLEQRSNLTWPTKFCTSFGMRFLFCRPHADDSGVGPTEVRQK